MDIEGSCKIFLGKKWNLNPRPIGDLESLLLVVAPAAILLQVQVVTLGWKTDQLKWL